MPWYYAGPEAKPLGPFSVEEMHERRVRGDIGPETFIIEHTGANAESMAWKRFKDVFPTNLPPTSPVASVTLPPIVLAAAPHPLFPSAAAPSPAQTVYPHYHSRPTNAWCAWGFFIGLGGFFFSFVCIGFLLAFPALLLCTIGLVQVRKNPGQDGQGLAISGLILSTLAILISFIFVAVMAMPILKAHGLTVTEQTSNDSE